MAKAEKGIHEEKSLYSIVNPIVNRNHRFEFFLIEGSEKTFEIMAEHYKFSLSALTVNKGDKVIIKAIAIDKDHGIGIKPFNINKLLPKGEWVTIEFTADKKGNFTIRCTKFCGWKHFWM